MLSGGCYGLDCVPKTSVLRPWLLGPQNVTLMGNSIVADPLAKMRADWNRVCWKKHPIFHSPPLNYLHICMFQMMVINKPGHLPLNSGAHDSENYSHGHTEGILCWSHKSLHLLSAVVSVDEALKQAASRAGSQLLPSPTPGAFKAQRFFVSQLKQF